MAYLRGLPGATIEAVEQYWDEQYRSGCCHPAAGLDDPYEFAPPKTSAPFDQMLKYIYKNYEYSEGLVKVRTRQYAQHLWEAVEKGYGSGLEIGDEYKAALNKNIWQFAAAKAHSELKTIQEHLVDKDGLLRTDSAFRAAAYNIAEKHDAWLKAEKATAFRSGQMAHKWQDAQATKGMFPLMEFDAVLDDHTTDLCRSLDKVVVPIGHPYLETYWPPNHFYCRLNVRKLSKGTVTPDDKLPYPVIPNNFKQNLAAQGQALPMQGVYFRELGPAKISDEKIGYVATIYDEIFEFADTGRLRVHALGDKNKSAQHIRAGKILAEKGHQLDLTPEIIKYDKQARRVFYPELADDNYSNPDGRFDKVLADLKIPDALFIKKRNIINYLGDTHKKGASVCVISLLNREYVERDILTQIMGSLKKASNYPNINRVVLVLKDERVVNIPREMTLQDNFYELIKPY